MGETHLRRVPFVPADEPDQSLRARARRRMAALAWSRRHSLRWLVPPLVASALVNGVLLLSALTEPDEPAPLASTRVTSALNAASAKVGPTTSILEQGAEFAGSISSVPPSTTATTPATSELAISPTSTASPATGAPSSTAAPTTAAPTTDAPAPAGPTTAAPATAAPTTEPRPEPAAAPPTTAPAVDQPTPTVAIRTPPTESTDDDNDDREDRQDDREDDRSDRRAEREDDRSDRRDERNRRD